MSFIHNLVTYLSNQDLHDSAIYIIKGIPVTLGYTILSLVIGFILAIIVAIIQVVGNNRFIMLFKFIAKIYVSVFRGTPMIVQILLIYQGLPLLIGWVMSPFTAGVIALSLNSGAYVSETIRAGIESIDSGQFEGAEALHIPTHLLWRDIILPQAFRNILPALFNEAITLLKDTALISYIGVTDILERANEIGADTSNYLEPLMIASVVYYILVCIITTFARLIEANLKAKS